MLIICSNGLSSENVLYEMKKHIKNAKRAALVVTADNEYKEKNYHVPRCTKELESLGLRVDCIDIDKEDTSCLRAYDVVEFIGGNPFYLLHSLRQHCCKEVLQELVNMKIVIGWSGGSFPLLKSLNLVNLYIPEQNYLKLTDLTGMQLADVEVLPHYKRFSHKYDKFEERCCEYEREYGVSVIRINDGDGVFISEKVKVVRG